MNCEKTKEESDRFPRKDAIYIPSANQGNRSYKPDSETTFRAMIKPAQINQDQFQEWLYSYNPSQTVN